jgi:chromosome segregation ATPase
LRDSNPRPSDLPKVGFDRLGLKEFSGLSIRSRLNKSLIIPLFHDNYRESKRLKEDLESVKSSQKRVQDQLEARVNEIKKEFNTAASRVQEVQKESDDLKIRLRDLQLRLEKAHFSRARMDDLETQIRDLKRSLDKARQARDDARLSLDQERERVKAMPTITALKELMDAQEQGIKSIRAAAAQDKEAARDAAQVKGRLDVAERALSEKDAHIALLMDKLGKVRAKLSRTRYLSEKEADLTLFMELTKQALVGTDGTGTDSSKTSPQALAAQLNVLQARVADLEKDLFNARKEATELQGMADEGERKYVQMKARCEASEGQVKELVDKLSKEEASSEELENQLEQMFSSHEETAERNKEMIETLRLTQEANVKLAREAQEAQMERAALEEQRREMDGESARNEEDTKKLNNRINELEQQQKRIMMDLEAAMKESQAMAKKCDLAVAQLKEKEHAVSSALKEAEAARLDSERRAADRDDQETKARKEATKAERLQSEVDALKSRLHQMGASPQGLASELQQECDALRSLLNCPVCRTRQKNTLIMQCNHVFCEECVKVNLANRHRKCPSCNTRFGEGDVKTIYLTSA